MKQGAFSEAGGGENPSVLRNDNDILSCCRGEVHCFRMFPAYSAASAVQILGRETGSRKWPECFSDHPEGSFLWVWLKDYGNRCDVQLQRKQGFFFFLNQEEFRDQEAHAKPRRDGARCNSSTWKAEAGCSPGV